MENNLSQIENILQKADFSKETDLKLRLSKELFSVRKVTLDELVKEEGLNYNETAVKTQGRIRVSERQKQKQKEALSPKAMGNKTMGM